jgi:ribonucleoside-diphosphate reductase alpha chain
LNALCKVFTDLKFDLGRSPLKKEFISHCKKIGQNYRLYLDGECAEDNGKISWNVLKEAAGDYNHRVASVEFCGYEDVYNMTVDDNHNFAITLPGNENNKYYQIFTRQCGEACLEEYGICNLGSVVLSRFVANVNTNWKRMEEVVRTAVRFLDNVIDLDRYILKQFDDRAHAGRRIGVGVMGLADYMMKKRIRYGSKKCIEETERIFRFLRDVAYSESIKIASEKGAFPKYDTIEYGKAHFVRGLPASTRMEIKRHGIRNVTLLSIAPTGTISMIPEVCGGIEPLFAKAYRRLDRVSERYYVHPEFRRLVREGSGEMPDWMVDTFDLDPCDHLDIQVAVQKYVDGAVSKTINMPKGTTAEDLSGYLLEYIKDLKGVTVYVDESRENQPIKRADIDEAVRTILDEGTAADTDSDQDAETLQCASGKCEI